MSCRTLRQKPRVSYYEPDEPALDEYVFCEECADYVFEYCAIHGPLLVIPDDKPSSKPNMPDIVPRAALTIPHVFLHLAPSIIPGAGIGVFSTLTLPRGVRFGPYCGQRTDSVDSMYCWQMYDGERRRSHVLDAADARRSNWMRYVNCARHWAEQNLVAYQYRGQLYYRTIKLVPRFTELMVFYGSEFANILRINLAAYNAPRGYASKFGAPVPKKPKLALEKPRLENISSSKAKTNKQAEAKVAETKINNKAFVTHKPTNNNISYKCENDVNIKKCSQDVHVHQPARVSEDTKPKVSSVCRVKAYTCNTCNKQFTRKKHLVVHLRAHTGLEPYTCDICTKHFTRKESLDLHICTHSVEKSYECDICNKSFTEESDLNLHIRTHTKEKPFQCDICNKSFTAKSSLNTHTRIHTGHQPYICDICNKSFSLKGNLYTHIRTHTKEKPFQCDICNKRFSDKSSLNRHTRIHTGHRPYICDICNKSFSLKGNLYTHIRTHTKEKPFQCDICNKRFSDKSNLNTHTHIHTGHRPYMYM